MNDEIVYLMTAENEPIAQMWEQILRDAGIPALVRAEGPGMGGWASVALSAHDLYVRESDLERARQIMKEEVGEDAFAE